MDKIRVGLFTSSQIYRLMGTDKVMATYIKEKARERRLGVEIDLQSNARPLMWGKAMEGYVYENYIEIDYAIESTNTDVHESGNWCGTKDYVKSDTVADQKCPITRTSFCELVEIIESNDIEIFKKEKPEYYWQIVSNATILDKPYGELIVFFPYENEISKIIEYIDLIDDFKIQMGVQWVIHSDLNEIPHIPDNSGYINLYRFKFLVPPEDKLLLKARVEVATKELNKSNLIK